MSAEFRYCLYNYLTGSFSVKHVKESRIFSFRSIQNLDEAINEFRSVTDSCIKVPQMQYIMIPSKAGATAAEIGQNFEKFQKSVVDVWTVASNKANNIQFQTQITLQNVTRSKSDA